MWAGGYGGKLPLKAYAMLHNYYVVSGGWGKMENWYQLRSLKPGIRARDLCKQYQIETLREYRHRSREQINDARAKGNRI